MEWTEKMRKFNLLEKLLPLLIYNGISAVLVLVSLFVFNKAVLVLDILAYVASVTAMLMLRTDFLSSKYGALNVLHMLIPFALLYRIEAYHLLDYSPAIVFGVFAAVAMGIIFWLRTEASFALPPSLVALVFCAVVFCATFSAAILTNCMFDGTFGRMFVPHASSVSETDAGQFVGFQAHIAPGTDEKDDSADGEDEKYWGEGAFGMEYYQLKNASGK